MCGHVEEMGPAGNVGGDGGGTGRAQTMKSENHRPSQQVWGFIQLTEKKTKASFRQVSVMTRKSTLAPVWKVN